MMLRRAGIEGVGADLVSTFDEAEALASDDEMQIAAHAADRAVAFLGLDLVGRQHLEAHGAAMAPALLPAHLRFGHQRQLR